MCGQTPGKERKVSDKRYSVDDIMSMEPKDLMEYLVGNFSINIPTSITTAEDLRMAAEILSRSYSYYSFLSNMRLTAKMQKRALKRQKESSEEIEKMLMREELFEMQAGIAKHAYDTVSRMVTIKQQINQELKMMAGI